jgi:hypothetical protein
MKRLPESALVPLGASGMTHAKWVSFRAEKAHQDEIAA